MLLNPRSSRTILNLMICCLLIGTSLLAACDEGKPGTTYKVLVVLQKWNMEPNCTNLSPCTPNFSAKDISDIHEPRQTGEEYIQILDERINAYYQKATFGQVQFDFELLEPPADDLTMSTAGWWNARYPLSYINKNKIGWKQIAVDIAYNALGDGIANYDRILFISNMQHRGGQMCCLASPTPFYEFPTTYQRNLWGGNQTDFSGIPMIVAEVGEGEDEDVLITVASHELGHMIGAPDQYYGGSPGMGPWDIMGQDWFYFHFGAWTKLDQGWIDWNGNTTMMPCNSGECEITTTLDPVETQGNNALLIPTGTTSGIGEAVAGGSAGPTFVGIMAECRKPINGDEKIPEQGVLVTFSNPFINQALAGTVSEALTNEGDPYALLQPGESYFNDIYNIQITNISTSGESTCTVKARRTNESIPDLYITQGAVTAGSLFDRYQSPDIWNDTLLNGVDKYPNYETLSKVVTKWNNTVPVPAGYGDPIIAAPGWDNIVNAMIHNGGTAAAVDSVVNIYLRQPLILSVQTEDCGAPPGSTFAQYLAPPVLLASNSQSELLPGQVSIALASYQTALNSPLEITVEIEPAAGEVNLDNNVARETYVQFQGQVGVEIGIDAMGVTVGSQCTQGIPYVAMEVPAQDGSICEGWDLAVYPGSGFLEPGETENFTITGVPPVNADPGDTCSAQFSILMPIYEGTFIPVESFTFLGRVVEPATLTCSAPDGANPVNVPLPVSGKLDPGMGEAIALLYTDPLGAQVVRNLLTQNSGNYSDMFTPGVAGQWTVQAIWVGDESHAPTQSDTCQFLVQDALPRFIADEVANCRQGPSVVYLPLGATSQGNEYPITGVLNAGGWYRIDFNETTNCWVSTNTGHTSGDVQGVPGIHIDIITPTPEAINWVAYCGQFTSIEMCQNKHGDVCRWNSLTCEPK